MDNVIDLIQKMKKKEGNRYIELLEKAVSNLSINEQLEFKKLHDERDAMFLENMREAVERLKEIEKEYSEYTGDVSEFIKMVRDAE